MNSDIGWVERFNSTVRGIVTLLLTITFCWLAVKNVVDPGIFANVLSSVVAFWFAAKAAERMLEKSPPPPGTVTEVRTATPAQVVTTTTAPAAPAATPPTP